MTLRVTLLATPEFRPEGDPELPRSPGRDVITAEWMEFSEVLTGSHRGMLFLYHLVSVSRTGESTLWGGKGMPNALFPRNF